MREGRAFGLSVIVSSQFATDLPTPVSGSTATKMYFGQSDIEQIRSAQRTILGKTTGAEADHLSGIIRALPPLACVLFSRQVFGVTRVNLKPYFERVT